MKTPVSSPRPSSPPGVPILWALLVVAVSVGGCTDISTNVPGRLPIEEVEFAPELGIDLDDLTRLQAGLYIENRVLGDGAAAGELDELLVQFTGWLPDGRVFDRTRGENEDGVPFRFVLGTGDVIPGWDEGIPGMREGGVRLLVIPPELAFGRRGSSSSGGADIPPNSWVVFEVELVEVLSPGSG